MIEFWTPIIFITIVTVLAAYVFRPGQHHGAQVSPPEAALVLLGGFLLVHLMWSWGISRKVTDVENLSGVIVSKGTTDVNCRHCHTVCDSYDSKGNCTSSHEVCSHSFDRDWWAKTDYAEFFDEGIIKFPTTDSQGLVEPERWTKVEMGDWATTLHSYTNWLRGAGKTSVLFPSSYLTDELAGLNFFPPRAQSLHRDFYIQPRSFYVGYHPWGDMVRLDGNIYVNENLTERLMEVNSIIGPEKQGNLQIFLVEYPNPEYANAYMDFHQGGAKNDINVFVGMDEFGNIEWVQVKFGLPGFDQTEIDDQNSSNALLAVTIRDDLMKLSEDHGVVRGAALVDIPYSRIMDGFDRVPNKQFEYLKDQLRPEGSMMLILWIIVVAYLAAANVVALASRDLDIK